MSGITLYILNAESIESKKKKRKRKENAIKYNFHLIEFFVQFN